MKKRLLSLALAMLMMLALAAPAFAAPSKQQVDFISRMSGKGLCVQLSSYVYYVEGNAIYRMSSKGENPTKLFEMNNPRDLQIHGSYIYFIDEIIGDEPSETQAPTAKPSASATADPNASADPTDTPDPDESTPPSASPTAEETATPNPTPTPSPTVAPVTTGITVKGKGSAKATKTSYTLYRFRGTTKPTKQLDDVYDAVIGGDIMYYTNAARNMLYSWNLRTGAKRTMHEKLFSDVCDINYMQDLLLFTARMNDAENSSYFVHSKSSNVTMYYAGSAKGMLAYSDSIYMPEETGYIRMTFDAKKPSLTKGAVILGGVTEAIASGSSFYYVKENDKKAQIFKKSISGGTEALVDEFDAGVYDAVYLEPAGSYIWMFGETEEKGIHFVKRLDK